VGIAEHCSQLSKSSGLLTATFFICFTFSAVSIAFGSASLRIDIIFQQYYSISIMDIYGFFRLGLITYPNGY
jgi:hypothetical protein